MIKCKICKKEFKNRLACAAHQKIHSPNYEEHKRRNIASTHKTQQIQRKARILKYLENPVCCKQCNTSFEYEQRHQKFCNRSCSAIYNNTKRDPEIYVRHGQKLKEKYRLEKELNPPPLVTITGRKRKAKEVSGPHSKLFKCTCAHCGKVALKRVKTKYCETHAYLYKNNNRNRYAFTFRLDQHPLLFDELIFEKIKKHGFWSPTNTGGMTRDHKISVAESIRNGHDPYYIKHPVNCEIMSWDKNNRKNTDCSITYTELVDNVIEYDSKYNGV